MNPKTQTMKTLLILVALVYCTMLNAQDTLQISVSADTSTTYLIILDDNTSLTGNILERKSNEIIFNDLTIGRVAIPMIKIKKMTSLSGYKFCILTTNDGKKFTGLIISHNDTEVTIKTESLGILTISNNKIRDIKIAEKEQIKNGKYFFPNPHPTRYFFGPSAIPLEKGEGYFQNAWILSNSVQIGVSDHFSMGGGVVIPVLFFITPKVGYKVAKNVHIGGGLLAASTISTEASFGLGVAYGSLTFGSKENNFTIDAGWGFIKQEHYNSQTSTSTYKWGFAEKPMFSFSGALRIAPMCSLISENWVFATKDYSYNQTTYTESYTYKYHSVLSFGFRLMGEKNSFDLALALPTIEGGTVGIPYLDYVFKF